MENLKSLAALIQKRNAWEREITSLIGRPAQIGHIGEYIASQIFSIDLMQSASHKGIDGRFTKGLLIGKSVNVKWYALREYLLDINATALPDYYLVLTGKSSPALNSRGRTRPWTISSVFLFEALSLVSELGNSGVKIGIATSVRQHLWEKAEIYPTGRNSAFELSTEQQEALMLFGDE